MHLLYSFIPQIHRKKYLCITRLYRRFTARNVFVLLVYTADSPQKMSLYYSFIPQIHRKKCLRFTRLLRRFTTRNAFALLVFWKAYIDRMLFGYANC